MRWRLLPAMVFLAGRLDAQEPDPTVLLADLATRGDAAAADAVRRHRESVAGAITVILERAHSGTVPTAVEHDLEAAERLALTHARAFGDSSILRGVRAFRGWSRVQRDRKLAADRLRRKGNSALPSGGVSAAMPHWRASLRLASSVPDASGIAAALGNIGAGFYRAGELDSAQFYLERARRLAERAGEIRIAANAMTTLATLLLDRGRLRPARALYGEALVLRGRIGDVRGEAADRNNSGLVDQALGNLASARESFETSLRRSRQHDLTDASGLSLMNLGNLDALAGHYSAAASRYEAALVAYRTTGNRLDGAAVLHNYGVLELRHGRYPAAAERLSAALEVYDVIGSEAQRIEVRNDLTAALLASGDLQGALAQLRRMKNTAAHASGSSTVQADLALTSAEVALQFNALADAAREYARAETLYVRAGDAAGVAVAREGGAFLLLLRGDFATARRVFENVADLHARAGDRRAAGIARMLAGAAGRHERRFLWARGAFDEAVSDFRAVKDRVGEAAALGESAELYLSVRDLGRSESTYRRALRILGTRASPISWRLHAGLGRLLQTRTRPAEAAAELRRAVNDIESLSSVLTLSERRAAYMDDKWDVYAALAQLESFNGNPGAAFDMSERMRARQTLDLLARAPVPMSRRYASSARGREVLLRRQIAILRSDITRPPDYGSLRDPGASSGLNSTPAAVVLDAQRRYAELLRGMETSDPGYAALARGETISWRNVAARLKPNETLVEYMVSDSSTLVFVVRRRDVSVLELKIGRRALAAAIDFARESVRRPGRDHGTMSWRPPLRHLYRELIGPLDQKGLLAGTERLIVIPHAELHYLPFAALIRAGARERFLVEQYEIEYAPSASVWVRLGERYRGGRVVGANVLALAPRPRSLVGSSEEVSAIRAGYGPRADVWIDASASEALFRSVAGRYGIIHLATAGVMDSRNPLLSFIELRAGGGEDGRLEVHEVFGLALSARLVVLSACETALAAGSSSDVPAGDDWVGLTQAFLQAGATNVLGTLWRVDDRATAHVMSAFYTSLRSGRSESASLAAAQRVAIRQAHTADPFYWAGFVMNGTAGNDSRGSGSRL